MHRIREKEGQMRVFEYIYFARPTACLTASAFTMPASAGRAVPAMDSPVDADLVVGVPESGNAAALGLTHAVRHSLTERRLLKNSYVGRTFIEPKQSSRESSVRVKLNVLKEAVAENASS